MCFFRKKQKESKVKNVKFNDIETVIKVDKINYIDIVGDFRDPVNNPNYSLIGQSRAFRLNKFALNCPLFSWNSSRLVFHSWGSLVF